MENLLLPVLITAFEITILDAKLNGVKKNYFDINNFESLLFQLWFFGSQKAFNEITIEQKKDLVRIMLSAR